jgi:hypothetical protein
MGSNNIRKHTRKRLEYCITASLFLREHAGAVGLPLEIYSIVNSTLLNNPTIPE